MTLPRLNYSLTIYEKLIVPSLKITLYIYHVINEIARLIRNKRNHFPRNKSQSAGNIRPNLSAQKITRSYPWKSRNFIFILKITLAKFRSLSTRNYLFA